MNPNPDSSDPDTGQYRVVALKYRPLSFGDLVGQNHIATALSNAIDKNRVGHAYLFTGARGVGKTSSARIFAKCLNCEQGPTKEPCGECDICQSISSGEDVDVLEIDGASNRGIDEIRQLRSNAAVRPSRSRYKIYIIDEVHMLTTQAFNALLKTLEEPPGHVKFIFCTTDPQKIPITVLSRCQRFDFSPVQTDEIAKRLREIAENEGVQAEDAALGLLARRANGSMRDSQSLLEQLFSFCGTKITVEEVHQLLGTADMSRIADIATAMANANPTETLNLIHLGLTEGVDAGQMADQLLGYFRDMMAVRVGCGEDTLLNCTAPDLPCLTELAELLGLETILTIVQLLDAAVVRMQSSLHARTLLEAAAIRVCSLEKLDAISDLVTSLASAGGGKTKTAPKITRQRPRVEMRQVDYKSAATPASKKNEIAERVQPASSRPADVVMTTEESVAHSADVNDPADPDQLKPPASDGSNLSKSNPVASTSSAPVVHKSIESATPVETAPPVASTAPNRRDSADQVLTSMNVETYWKQMLDEMGDMTADMASDYESLVLKDSERLVVTLMDTVSTDLCSKPERKQKFETALAEITGTRIRVDFMASKKARQEHAPAPKLTRVQQIRRLQEDSLVKQTLSLFDAEITGYREPARTKRKKPGKI